VEPPRPRNLKHQPLENDIMKTLQQLKTLDVQAKEWFDRQNGNSYFSALVTLNYGLADEERHPVQMQYGYGSQFETAALETLQTLFPRARSLKKSPLWRWCQDHRVILRTSKEENCGKRDVKQYGETPAPAIV